MAVVEGIRKGMLMVAAPGRHWSNRSGDANDAKRRYPFSGIMFGLVALLSSPALATPPPPTIPNLQQYQIMNQQEVLRRQMQLQSQRRMMEERKRAEREEHPPTPSTIDEDTTDRR